MICSAVAFDSTEKHTCFGWMSNSYVNPITANSNLRDTFIAMDLECLKNPLFELAFGFVAKARFDRDAVARELRCFPSS